MGSPVRAFHKRAVPSFEAVSTRVPSELNQAARTPLPCGIGLPTRSPLAVIQICAAFSGAASGTVGQISGSALAWESAAVKTWLPSGLNATLSTHPR
jgi:hypothetical protein